MLSDMDHTEKLAVNQHTMMLNKIGQLILLPGITPWLYQTIIY